MLVEGQETQPTFYSNLDTTPTVPSALPKGRFLIDAYPVKAVDFLLRADLPGRIWNHNGICGYLIWRLAPEHYLLFSDNRYDIYGGLFVRDENSVASGWTADFLKKNGMSREEGFKPWNEVLDHWAVQTILIPTNAAGNKNLLDSGAWERVWEDLQLNIWVRKTPQNAAAIARALAMPRPNPWIQVVGR